MNLFTYRNYQKYITDLLDKSNIYGGRGARKRLSEALNSHLPYITQVLKGDADFSVDQAQAFCEYACLNEMEAEYFLTLVELNKASHPRLKKRYEQRLALLKSQSQSLSERLEKTPSANEMQRYYSSWLHGAIHAGLSIPKYNQNLPMLAKDLGIPLHRLSEVIGDLVKENIVKAKGERLELTNRAIHLRSDAVQIHQHHLNWRSKCAELIQRGDSKGTTYSSVVSVSAGDVELINEKIINFIKEIKSIIKDSAEEKIYSFCLDFIKIAGAD